MGDLFPIPDEEVIAELRREITMRHYVYPRYQKNNKMTALQERRIACLERAIEIIQERPT